MSEHTKGPWKVSGRLPYIVAITAPRYNVRGTMIISRGIETGGQDWPAIDNKEREANARLIAAAPDLLEACKLALHNEHKRWDEIKKVLEAAIAKAEK